jgi:transposase
MDNKATDSIVTAIGIDIGKNTFHLVGLDERGAIVLRQKLSRGQVSARLANMPPCLVGMEACVVLPIRRHAFLSRRFSRVSSATTSFRADASRRRSLTSSEVALPASRKSFDQR